MNIRPLKEHYETGTRDTDRFGYHNKIDVYKEVSYQTVRRSHKA